MHNSSEQKCSYWQKFGHLRTETFNCREQAFVQRQDRIRNESKCAWWYLVCQHIPHPRSSCPGGLAPSSPPCQQRLKSDKLIININQICKEGQLMITVVLMSTRMSTRFGRLLKSWVQQQPDYSTHEYSALPLAGFLAKIWECPKLWLTLTSLLRRQPRNFENSLLVAHRRVHFLLILTILFWPPN